jgi:putative sterol carrier protein
VATYPFLSDDWIAEARKIRREYQGRGSQTEHVIRMNQVITEVPFGEGAVNAHIDTSSGEMELEVGHIEGADVKVTIDYATAKAILVDGNPQAAMQAFMAGRIKVEGDMSKLMAMLIAVQAAPADPVATDIATRIKDITG